MDYTRTDNARKITEALARAEGHLDGFHRSLAEVANLMAADGQEDYDIREVENLSIGVKQVTRYSMQFLHQAWHGYYRARKDG